MRDVVVTPGSDGTGTYQFGPYVLNDDPGAYVSIRLPGSPTLGGNMDIYASSDNIGYHLLDTLVITPGQGAGIGVETIAKYIDVRWRHNSGTGTIVIHMNIKENGLKYSL